MRLAQSSRPRKPHSEETRAKIGAAHRGRKQSPESIEKRRLALSGRPGSRLGTHCSEETKQKLREARKRQIHPSLAARGITLEMEAEAKANGLRWCSGECKAFLPADKFYGKSRRQGYCGECIRKSTKKFKDENWTPEQRAENAAYLVKYREDNPDAIRRLELRKYGVTPEWYEEKLAEQGGHCALCPSIVDERKLASWCKVKERKYLLVDHDHETGAVRGLLCAKCNTALHRVEYVEDWALKALAYLRRYCSTVKTAIPASAPAVVS